MLLNEQLNIVKRRALSTESDRTEQKKRLVESVKYTTKHIYIYTCV